MNTAQLVQLAGDASAVSAVLHRCGVNTTNADALFARARIDGCLTEDQSRQLRLYAMATHEVMASVIDDLVSRQNALSNSLAQVNGRGSAGQCPASTFSAKTPAAREQVSRVAGEKDTACASVCGEEVA